MKDELTALAEAAKGGDIDAQYNLAAKYATGDDIEQDAYAAASWYDHASRQGHPDATYNLAWYFLTGEAGHLDVAKGLALLRTAVQQGSRDAPELLGEAFAKGLFGVQVSIADSLAFHLVSVYRGNRKSFEHLLALLGTIRIDNALLSDAIETARSMLRDGDQKRDR